MRTLNLNYTISIFLLFIGLTIYGQSGGPENQAHIIIKAGKDNPQISRHIYGHFSEHLGHCIYGGYWVGEESGIPNTRGIRNDVVEALKAIEIPNLRWPGGCFADEYHWKDGIGSPESRPKMINTHWGGVTEDNRFGTHEFMDLCEQLGTEPYICGNVGSGTVQEMSEWVEYLNFDAVSPMADLRRKNGKEEAWSVKFWGVGNENWGCGGNMTADFYADQYRRYATYCRNYGGKKLYKIAGGASSDDFNWTETLMKKIPHHMMDGISLHHYNVVWSKKGSASEFGEEEYFQVLNRSFEMERIIDRHIDIMDRLDPANKVALIVDEWGSWYDVEPKTNPGFLFQQNSMRDAMVAALALNYFNKNCDRIRMTNIAQTVNVLQALIFTKDEKMVLTPTYHVYDLFKVHQDARLLESEMICDSYHYEGRELPAVHHSSSMDQEGKVHISLVNIDPNRKAKVDISLVGFKHKKLSGKILTSEKINDINTFEVPNKVSISEFKDFEATKNGMTLTMPAKSIIVMELK